MTKNRIPRKSKKWHRKHGWTIHFSESGQVYFTRDYPRFRIMSLYPWKMVPK